MTHFRARLGSFMRAYTVFIFVALTGAALFSFLRGDNSAAFSLLAVLVGLLLIGLFSVRGYDVDRGQLIIERPAWKTYVDLSDLSEAEVVPRLVNSSISTWSTRGLFGFIGYGYASKIGSYRAYVTDSSKAVLLRFSSGKMLVVSPDSPTEFITVLMAGLKESSMPERGHG
jgi:hypothetical protein